MKLVKTSETYDIEIEREGKVKKINLSESVRVHYTRPVSCRIHRQLGKIPRKSTQVIYSEKVFYFYKLIYANIF